MKLLDYWNSLLSKLSIANNSNNVIFSQIHCLDNFTNNYYLHF